MGGEDLGPVKAKCPCVGECQGGEAGVDGHVGEYHHRSRGWGGGWDRGFLETRKGDNI